MVIREEINIIAAKYGDDRRTAIGFDDDMSMEDLIPDEDTVVAMTHLAILNAWMQIISRARTGAEKVLRECRPLRRTILKTFL